MSPHRPVEGPTSLAVIGQDEVSWPRGEKEDTVLGWILLVVLMLLLPGAMPTWPIQSQLGIRPWGSGWPVPCDRNSPPGIGRLRLGQRGQINLRVRRRLAEVGMSVGREFVNFEIPGETREGGCHGTRKYRAGGE